MNDEAKAKLDAACVEAHDLGRHAQPAQFIGFCPSCQAEAEAIEVALETTYYPNPRRAL